MDRAQIFKFIAKRKTAFIASVNEHGYPVTRAMLAPRKIEGHCIYFSTNTSSKKVGQFIENNKACVYFYKRWLVRYRGVAILGEMEVCTDQAVKDMIWRSGDSMFYKRGATDPDYCVLKFTGAAAEWYCDLKSGSVEL